MEVGGTVDGHVHAIYGEHEEYGMEASCGDPVDMRQSSLGIWWEGEYCYEVADVDEKPSVCGSGTEVHDIEEPVECIQDDKVEYVDND